MIGRLEGVLIERQVDGACIVDIAGVGYEVHVPLGALGALPPPPDTAVLHIHTHVREDQITLFGFPTADDRAAFRALLTVSNVGPKLAMAVLSVLDSKELARAVAAEDRTRFKGIPGVGSKTVERIFLDLKGKLVTSPSSAGSISSPARKPASRASHDVRTVVAGALVQMGYKAQEAERAVALIEETDGKPVEVLLREALNKLS